MFIAYVFNAEQIEGVPPAPSRGCSWNPLEKAEQLVQAANPKLQHAAGDGGSARRLQAHSDQVCFLLYQLPPRNIHGNRVEQPARSARISETWSVSWKELLIDVTRWQSPDYNSLAQNFLLHRKRNPFLRRIWIGPQSAEIIEHLLFVLGQSRALK